MKGTFLISFHQISTESSGLFVAHVPVILNGNRDIPYRTLTLRGELLAPNLTFDPESVRLMPVPLNTQVSVNFNIIARGYRRYVNRTEHAATNRKLDWTHFITLRLMFLTECSIVTSTVCYCCVNFLFVCLFVVLHHSLLEQ